MFSYFHISRNWFHRRIRSSFGESDGIWVQEVPDSSIGFTDKDTEGAETSLSITMVICVIILLLAIYRITTCLLLLKCLIVSPRRWSKTCKRVWISRSSLINHTHLELHRLQSQVQPDYLQTFILCFFHFLYLPSRCKCKCKARGS